MARKPAGHLPELLLHKSAGQAYVILTNPRGSRRRYYFGRPGPEAQDRYQKLVGEWIAMGRELPNQPREKDARPTTLAELCRLYQEHAESYYRTKSGELTGEHLSVQRACELLVEFDGKAEPEGFSPKRLLAFGRTLLVRPDQRSGSVDPRAVQRHGKMLSRGYVNKILALVKRMFRWAESMEFVTGGTYHALATVPQFQAGRFGAREGDGLSPVPLADVEATLPHLNRHVRTMVEVMLLTGARCGEIVQLASRHVDRTGKTWVFRPPQHKSAHRGKPREVLIGAKAQALLLPFVKLSQDDRWFRPDEAVEERMEMRSESRRTPKWRSHMARNATKRKATEERQRPPGDSYDTHAVGKAIARACKRAGVEPWSPHRLRHAALTRIREEFGIEAAAAVAGHSTLTVTERYSLAARRALASQTITSLG